MSKSCCGPRNGPFETGKVSVDGTKIKANASKHHALSWDHVCKLKQQLQAGVEELIRLAERADTERIPDGMDIPKEPCGGSSRNGKKIAR